jgi:hypothetical protein
MHICMNVKYILHKPGLQVFLHEVHITASKFVDPLQIPSMKNPGWHDLVHCWQTKINVSVCIPLYAISTCVYVDTNYYAMHLYICICIYVLHTYTCACVTHIHTYHVHIHIHMYMTMYIIKICTFAYICIHVYISKNKVKICHHTHTVETYLCTCMYTYAMYYVVREHIQNICIYEYFQVCGTW